MNNILDIAKLAGVSKSTVSRYLNGGSVSDKTRQKLDKIVKETGYTPNQFAQSLKAKRTNMIGVIVPRLNSYASNETLLGIETYLRQHNYQTLIANTDLSSDLELNAIKTFHTSKVDGMILLATEVTPSHIALIQSIDKPILLVGQQHPQIHSIIQNDYEAGVTIGKYFKQFQFNNVAYLGVPEIDIAVGLKRKQGVKAGYAQKLDLFETTFKLKDATKAAQDLVKQYQAIICATDNIALGVLKAAQQQGIKVPEQLSITGFGGYETTSIVTPMITTIRFPYFQTGERAASSLLRLIEDQEVPMLQEMTFTLDEKESVDKDNIQS
ncbi:LacI family DNA-binding transcriptional regulator [Macrococcus caseolyticus]|nr:LacI family DNA-binding transcriptional regulator [Macrococcus caseolyticus]MCE4958028.1 LacI family DNA-binding transcriptional regulator [Macrococcus caseolyticus]